MSDESKPTGRSRRGLYLGGGAAFVVLAVGLFLWDDYHPDGSMIDHPAEPPPLADPDRRNPKSDPPAPPEMTAIVGDLKVGSSVAGWKVEALTVSSRESSKGALTVALAKDQKSLVVWIAEKKAGKAHSPVQTDRYDFHYSAMGDKEPPDLMAVMADLVHRVRVFEGTPDAPFVAPSVCTGIPAAPSASAAPASSR